MTSTYTDTTKFGVCGHTVTRVITAIYDGQAGRETTMGGRCPACDKLLLSATPSRSLQARTYPGRPRHRGCECASGAYDGACTC